MTLPIDVVLAAERGSVPDARRIVAEALGADDIDDVVAADLLLVVSELVSNAVIHGAGPRIGLSVRGCDGSIELTVTSDGTPELGPVRSWTMPPPGSVGGRGLALVRTLSDRVDTRSADGRFAVTASRRC